MDNSYFSLIIAVFIINDLSAQHWSKSSPALHSTSHLT